MAYFHGQRGQEQEQAHEPLFNQPVRLDDDFEDDPDPIEDEDWLPDEHEERRRDRLRLAAGVGDFFGVIVGMVVTLILIALLISLIEWVRNDIRHLGIWGY